MREGVAEHVTRGYILRWLRVVAVAFLPVRLVFNLALGDACNDIRSAFPSHQPFLIQCEEDPFAANLDRRKPFKRFLRKPCHLGRVRIAGGIDPGEPLDGTDLAEAHSPYHSGDPRSYFGGYSFSTGFEVDVGGPTATRLGDELSIFCWTQVVGS
ncbi:hypothetical protein D9M69_636710 [compost metagenome]